MATRASPSRTHRFCFPISSWCDSRQLWLVSNREIKLQAACCMEQLGPVAASVPPKQRSAPLDELRE